LEQLWVCGGLKLGEGLGGVGLCCRVDDVCLQTHQVLQSLVLGSADTLDLKLKGGRLL
jgi:hypothetical protein